jgi:signal peptidase I
MSVSSSNGRNRSSLSNGQSHDNAPEGVLTLDEGTQTLTPAPVTTPGSRRGSDYRLRGLDFGAQSKSQPPILPARKDEPRRRHRRHVLIGWIVVLAVAAAVAVVLRLTVAEPFTVPSSAMAPTLRSGDRILVVTSRLVAGPIETGNIIVFRHPEPYPCAAGSTSAQDLVQRVIGMPGQTIWSARDSIYVDGRKVGGPLSPVPGPGRVAPKAIPLTTVPAGEYYVMGDNSSQSCDSRAFGPVPASSVIGKVVSIVLRGGHPYIHVF